MINVTELNEFFGTFEMTVKAYKVLGEKYTAEILYEFDGTFDNTGGSETLHYHDTIEELNEELSAYNIVINLGGKN